MMKKIYLFPDTNMFVQCKAINELDWSTWENYDEINILISRPVQAEIDNHKGSGNSRLSRRARTTTSFFREILNSEQGYVEIRSSNPLVRAYLRLDLIPDETLSGQLRYAERDDQLVGIAALFAKQESESQIRILTDDTGPMAKAQMIGIQFDEIPSSWFLPPETDEKEKAIKALRAELTHIKKAEPVIEVRFEGKEIIGKAIQEELIFFTPLGESEISTIKSIIEKNFPLETDYGPKNVVRRHKHLHLSSYSETEVYTPANEKEISNYINRHYPKWLENCNLFLQNAHKKLNANINYPTVMVGLKNIGGRPADDTRISLSAKGNFKLKKPENIENSEFQESERILALPYPPLAPKGHWEKQHSILGNLSKTTGLITKVEAKFDMSSFLPQTIKKLDPNIFYYQSEQKYPTKDITLTCEKWRHHDAEQIFEVEIIPNLTSGIISGTLEVKIQASNMTDVIIKHQLLSIKVEERNVQEKAEEFVNQLIEKKNNFSNY